MNAPFRLPNSSLEKLLALRSAQGALPRGQIDGLTLSNDTTDATNDIAIAQGVARSSYSIIDGALSSLARDQMDLELPVSIIKQLDTAYAPENYDPDGYSGGDRSGGRSSSSLANGTWLPYLIGSRHQQPDVIFHDSATPSSVAAILPAGYSSFRRIGAVLRSAGAILGFVQDGNNFQLKTIAVDFATTASSTNAELKTLTVPSGIRVKSDIILHYASTGAVTSFIIVSDPSTTDAAASTSNFSIRINSSSEASDTVDISVFTNTSAQIRARIDTTSIGYRILTRGWLDSRDRDL